MGFANVKSFSILCLATITLLVLMKEMTFITEMNEKSCQKILGKSILNPSSSSKKVVEDELLGSSMPPPPYAAPPQQQQQQKPPPPPPNDPPPSHPKETKKKINDVNDFQEKGAINFETIQVTTPFIKHSFPFSTYSAQVDPAVSKHIQDTKSPYCTDQLQDMIFNCVKNHNNADGSKRCVFVDVGANIGSCTVVAGLMGAKVYSFEALKDNAYLTYLNVAQNNLTGRVKVFPFGASSESKQIEIFRLTGNLGHNMVGEFQGNLQSEYSRDLTTIAPLDTIIKEHVNLMKMDIEGHEYLAVQGATKLFQEFGVDEFNFEFNPKYLTHDWKEPNEAENFLRHVKDKLGVTLYQGYYGGVFQSQVSDSDIKALAHPPNQQWFAIDLYGRQEKKP